MARKRTADSSGWQKLIELVRPVQREITGLLLLALSLITLLTLFSVTSGSWSDWWATFLRAAFGWGAYPAALLIGGGGLILLLDSLPDGPHLTLSLETTIGLEVLFVSALALLHLLSFAPNPLALAESGGGGGYVGWALSAVLAEAIGSILTLFVYLLLFFLGLALISRPTSQDLRQWRAALRRIIEPLRQERPPGEETQPANVSSRNARGGERSEGPNPPPGAGFGTRTLAARASKEQQASPKAKTTDSPQPRDSRLPPLDLLLPPAAGPSGGADARLQAQVIEETLAGFGVPVKVVEINPGPAVTQFGLEPGYIEQRSADGQLRQRKKIRVNMVSSLANDLALALAAAPIRIEAPVPGRPFIGVEVPNAQVSLVNLRSVTESATFQRKKGALKIALGLGVSGQAVAADLAAMPHLLIAGATGSGKSVCVNSIISCLLCNHTPGELKFLMIDPKMVELTNYNGIPHLLAPVVVELEQAVRALAWATREMDRRYHLFAASGVRNIAEYNRKVGKRGGEWLPFIVIVIDELADLMMTSPEEIERYICRIAQMARATGLHLVIATQRPSVDVVTGLIKANFPARVSFAVTSQVDSRVILDTGGAESLLGRGDMLYMAPDSSKLLRLQGCFVSDQEIAALVRFWREKMEKLPANAGETATPWAELPEDGEEDELLEEAIALVREHGRASISFLQRRMRIGYPRAARLVDLLEKQGVIGPDEGGGRPREVWMEDEVGG
jgi:S-DNA-T family DNA segregation ATPase FtsK/SpoIIIE